MLTRSVFYFDSCASVKQYIPERGTHWVRAILKVHKVVIAEIGIVEVAAALSKRKRMGDLSQSVYEDLLEVFLQDAEEEYHVLTTARPDFNLAVDLTRHHPLRAYDAVQLATALRLAEALEAENLSLIFVSADNQLCAAAEQEHLATVNPNLLSET